MIRPIPLSTNLDQVLAVLKPIPGVRGGDAPHGEIIPAVNFNPRLKPAHIVPDGPDISRRICPDSAGLPIKHEAHHSLTLSLLREIPRHGTSRTSMRALGPGAAVDTTPAEEATDHDQQNQETLSSHAGKLAVHPICWQACVRVGVASRPASSEKKDRWRPSTGLGF